MEGLDFNVTKNELSDPIYLDVSDTILKFKNQNAPAIKE
jgi:hypothetical protein